MTVTTWEDGAAQALQDIIDNHLLTEAWQDAPKLNYEYQFNAGSLDVIAADALNLLWADIGNQSIDQVRDGLLELYASKQNDYGSNNILKFGGEGVRIRLWDKISRLSNLRAKGVDPKNESIQDTLRDIIGYVVIAKMLDAGSFTLPLKSDLKIDSTVVVERIGETDVWRVTLPGGTVVTVAEQ